MLQVKDKKSIWLYQIKIRGKNLGGNAFDQVEGEKEK